MAEVIGGKGKHLIIQTELGVATVLAEAIGMTPEAVQQSKERVFLLVTILKTGHTHAYTHMCTHAHTHTHTHSRKKRIGPLDRAQAGR